MKTEHVNAVLCRCTRMMLLAMAVTLAVASCKTSQIPSAGRTTESSVLLADPQNRSFSGKLSVSIGQTVPVSLKTKMCWNEGITMSYSLIGLLDIASVSITPEKIIIVNRVNSSFCEADYSEIPYLDKLKLDFRSFQGLLWGRAFVYGYGKNGKASHLKSGRRSQEGNVTLTDERGGFQFDVDGNGQVMRTGKSTVLYNFSADYLRNGRVGSDNLPSSVTVNASLSGKSVNARIGYSGMSVSDGRMEPVRTDGLRKVTLSEMLGLLKEYL